MNKHSKHSSVYWITHKQCSKWAGTCLYTCSVPYFFFDRPTPEPNFNQGGGTQFHPRVISALGSTAYKSLKYKC